jgi:hypothetical protein
MSSSKTSPRLLPWYNWNVVPIATNLKKKIQINLDIIFQEIKQFLTDRLAEEDNDKDVHHDSLRKHNVLFTIDII